MLQMWFSVKYIFEDAVFLKKNTMSLLNTTKRAILIITFLAMTSCQEKEKTTTKTDNDHPRETVHIKTVTYNSEKSVVISGYDENGNIVRGSGIVEGKTGLGTIIKLDGKKKEIVFEVVNGNNITATDDDGIEYHLKTVHLKKRK